MHTKMCALLDVLKYTSWRTLEKNITFMYFLNRIVVLLSITFSLYSLLIFPAFTDAYVLSKPKYQKKYVLKKCAFVLPGGHFFIELGSLTK